MNDTNQNTALIKNLTLFFGGFLLFTDVFFLLFGIMYDMPLIRYVIYVKLVVNTSNIYLILKKHYLISTLIIYTVILAMMIAGVVSMGTRPAFQIYALGMLVCISYNSYMHKRVLKKELPFVPILAVHVLAYAGVYAYARNNEPLYEVPQSAVDILVPFNSVATFSIVIIYVWMFHNVAIRSEEKLEEMAMRDNLTGLYNRHFLLGTLDNMTINASKERWLALLDIDDFKNVNDTYGHNCGDYILHRVAEIAQEACSGCIICRWGGEEFIILSSVNDSTGLLESLRQRIADEEFSYDRTTLHITVTIGVASYDEEMTIDGWISKADERLYSGKSSGKNKVVT